MTFRSILYEVCYWSLWWGRVLRGNKWAAFMRLSVIMDLAVSFADSCKCLPDLWPVIFDGERIDVSSANDCELLILSSGIWKCSCTCIDPDCFPLYSSKCFSVLLILHIWGLGCVSFSGVWESVTRINHNSGSLCQAKFKQKRERLNFIQHAAAPPGSLKLFLWCFTESCCPVPMLS